MESLTMTDLKKQIAEYLELMRLRYGWNEQTGCFELPFTERKDALPMTTTISPQDKSVFRYTVMIRPTDKWVEIYTDICPLASIPVEKQVPFLLDLLAANRKYAEVCFDYDERRGTIGTSQEILSSSLNFDIFRNEFGAIPWAVKKFWSEIASKYGLAV